MTPQTRQHKHVDTNMSTQTCLDNHGVCVSVGNLSRRSDCATTRSYSTSASLTGLIIYGRWHIFPRHVRLLLGINWSCWAGVYDCFLRTYSWSGPLWASLYGTATMTLVPPTKTGAAFKEQTEFLSYPSFVSRMWSFWDVILLGCDPFGMWSFWLGVMGDVWVLCWQDVPMYGEKQRRWTETTEDHTYSGHAGKTGHLISHSVSSWTCCS